MTNNRTQKPATETTEAPKPKKSGQKKLTVSTGRAYIQASYNNTLVTITGPDGNVIAWSSSGSSGFKGTRKATPYAAQIAAENAVNKAKVYGLEKVDVYVKGIGAGREQALRGLHTAGLHVERITDTTTIPHNGCRPKKQRRV